MRNQVLLFISIIFLVFGCGNEGSTSCQKTEKGTSQRHNQRINKQYAKSVEIARKNFPDSVISHFPNEISDSSYIYIKLPNLDARYRRYGFTLFSKGSSKKIIEAKVKANALSYRKVNFFDANSIIVNSNIESVRKRIGNDSSLNPLPNFPEIFEPGLKIVKFTDLDMNDFDFFIINASPGRFLEEKYLTEGKGLPEQWKNGYSRGFAINEKDRELIYWYEVW